MSNYEYEFERAHYRIRYPIEVRPVYRVDVEGESESPEFPVIDCSERGLRYLSTGSRAPRIGDETRGVVHFTTGESVEVAGVVVRVGSGEVAVHLTEHSIPWRVMFQEQRFLRKHYAVSVLLE